MSSAQTLEIAWFPSVASANCSWTPNSVNLYGNQVIVKQYFQITHTSYQLVCDECLLCQWNYYHSNIGLLFSFIILIWKCSRWYWYGVWDAPQLGYSHSCPLSESLSHYWRCTYNRVHKAKQESNESSKISLKTYCHRDWEPLSCKLSTYLTYIPFTNTLYDFNTKDRSKRSDWSDWSDQETSSLLVAGLLLVRLFFFLIKSLSPSHP